MTQFTQRIGYEYLLSPTVGIIAALIVVSVWLGAKQSTKLNPADSVMIDNIKEASKKQQIIFTFILFLFSTVVFIAREIFICFTT